MVQILCQHEPELRRRLLPASEGRAVDAEALGALFTALDADCDGRVAVQDLVPPPLLIAYVHRH